jgi:hypothetical protein
MVATKLKDDILLASPADHPPDKPPPVLPPSITIFLGRICNLSTPLIVESWDSLKDTIWSQESMSDQSVEDLFQIHGCDLGFRM